MMPIYSDILLYGENKNKNKNKNKKENNYEYFNKKLVVDSVVNYPRMELLQKYKIQMHQIMMNKNYRNIFLKCLVIPLTFGSFYKMYKK